MRQAVLLAFLAIVLSACSEPLEFADWTIPVPEGTRVIEYAHVPLADRTERIELVEDLVISEGQEPFYRLTREPAADATPGTGAGIPPVASSDTTPPTD